METINVFEVLSEEDSKTIANLVWKLLDKAGIETTKDAALQVEVYDDDELDDNVMEKCQTWEELKEANS